MIPYGRQEISEDDIQAVVEALRSDWLTQGPMVDRLEAALVELTGAADAVVVANGTAALHLACMGLGLGPGDELWTVPNSFVASANCAIYCGADVDFVDIHPESFNLDPDALAAKLAAATRVGRLPKVIVPVHFAGQSCEMERIAELADHHGVELLEDASHAVGSSHGGRPVGACRHSSSSVFSFHPVKVVTTGEGGAITVRDPRLGARLRQLRHHGITRDPARMTGPSQGPWYYEQTELGYNYRLTDLQCALGLSQLRRLEEFVSRRNELARRYERELAGLPLKWQSPPPGGRSAHHLFVVTLDEAPRDAVFQALREAGIGVNVHYIPIHLQPFYRERGFSAGDFPVAEDYYERAITLPLYPGLSEEQQDHVVAQLRRILA